jgi:adenylate cyclase
MALYGAPVASADAAGQALATARDMVVALDELNRELAAEGRPPLAFGIGINTARVVAGNMGSKSRLNYTVVGDGVNLASRLESLTKDAAHAARIIMSESTLRAARSPPPVRPLGEVKVKGRTEAVKIFALHA